MKNRKDYLLRFMRSYDYPEAAVQTVLWAWDAVCADPVSAKRLREAISVYEADQLFAFKEQLEHLALIAKRTGVPGKTVDLLYVMSLTAHLEKLYEARNLPHQVYRDSMLDIRCKLLECRQVRKLWGLSVAYWYERFFLLTRFALGRLQFELRYAGSPAEQGGYRVETGDLWVNIHIPSSGPLTRELCEESFRQAYDWFRPLFPDGVVPFQCNSWLLSPEHARMLPPESNIRRFADFFNVQPAGRTVEKDLWRVFGMETDDYTLFPRDTALRRAYGEVLDKGEIPNAGRGIFFMKDEQPL